VSFVDTNVLVYAYDPTNPTKHTAARSLLERLWSERSGRISIQVLQELFATVTRKIPSPLEPHQAVIILRQLAHWPVFSPPASDVIAAVELTTEASVSFWDAMILVAAQRSGARCLWTEDLNDGGTILGVQIRSPFA
jgi:predicted nucleic acid-binding protein